MKKRLRLVFLPFLLCQLASAQIAQTGRALPDTRVMFVDAASVDGLTTLAAREDVDAVTLDVTRAALDARPAAEQALLSWVARGGVVYVHSDAAQLFGYRTVPVRAGTPQQAGQYFGRARAALPLGGHRLLWGNAARPTRGPRSLEVRVVFYQMTAGDQLVVDHAAGVGLLAVTDLAGPPTARPLYAAAVAPFGSGWALFTPYFVETHRADGAAFAQNLSRFAVEAGVTARHNLTGKHDDGDLVGIPGSLLDRAAGVGEAGAAMWSRLLLPAIGPTTNGGDTAVVDATPRRIAAEPALLVTRRDVRALSYGLSPDAGETAQAAARALLATLRARLALQRNLLQRAAEQLAVAAPLAPQSAEVLWLQGALAVASAEDISQPSQTRAVAFRYAAQNWDGALRGTSLSAYLVSQDPARLPGVPNSTAATLIGDVPRDLATLWRDNLAFLAAQAAAEPPLAQTLGTGGNATVMRYFAGDPNLNLLGPTANLLSRGDATVGWHADRQEVILFPNVNYLRAYRAASGVYPQQALLPEPWRGDVNDSRILMMSRASQVLGGPNPMQNTQPFIAGQTPDLTPAVLMARLHAYVLVNALAEGGTPVPVWMQLGLSGMVNAGTTSNLVTAARMAQATTMSLQARGVFSPEQFAQSGTPVNTLTSAEAQSLRLMLFFYNRFGAGRVGETLQRLGSGQNVDAALQATTGLTESQFFAAWQQAEFGR